MLRRSPNHGTLRLPNDDEKVETDIANKWGDHYETLLNGVKSDECTGKFIDFLSSANNRNNVFTQPCHVK